MIFDINLLGWLQFCHLFLVKADVSLVLIQISTNEPSHEIMLLFVFRNLILQTRMRNYPVALDVWIVVGPSSTFILYVCCLVLSCMITDIACSDLSVEFYIVFDFFKFTLASFSSGLACGHIDQETVYALILNTSRSIKLHVLNIETYRNIILKYK